MIRRLTILALTAAVGGIAPAWADPQPGETGSSVALPSSPQSAAAGLSPVERANADAVARLYAQIAAERLDDLTVGQLLERVDGVPLLMSGLANAEQVGGPRHVTDEFVQVQLQIGGARAGRLLMQAVAAKPRQSPIAPDRLAALLQAWSLREFSATGDSGGDPPSILAQSTQPQSRPAVALPERAPSWASEPIVASAVATPAASPLLTARSAERAARQLLRSRINQLKLDDAHSLEDLFTANPVSRDAGSRAIDNARVAGVDYRGDGTVEVRIALDGQRLWQTLQLAH